VSLPEDSTDRAFSDLRPWAPSADEPARERAAAVLAAHIERSARYHEPFWRRWQHRRWVVSAALALTVAGTGAAVAAVLLRTQHTGHLHVFTATGRLAPAFRVGSRGSGYCWTGSLATTAPDAYRCFQGNAIHDPCFAPRPRARMVACFLDPWHPVTLLRLTRPLPSHGPLVKDALPWAIVTTDGRRCVFLTGATAPMGGERINYGCVGGSYLLGAPDRREPLWTIRSAATYRPDNPRHPTPIADFKAVGISETVP
jgi:hypothetical protein